VTALCSQAVEYRQLGHIHPVCQCCGAGRTIFRVDDLDDCESLNERGPSPEPSNLVGSSTDRAAVAAATRLAAGASCGCGGSAAFSTDLGAALRADTAAVCELATF
jgi:hypothetical protein